MSYGSLSKLYAIPNISFFCDSKFSNIYLFTKILFLHTAFDIQICNICSAVLEAKNSIHSKDSCSVTIVTQ